MNKMQMMEIYDKLAALEAAAIGVPVDHEIWMLKEKLKALEAAIK